MADPSIKGPKYEPKLGKIVKPQICHPHGTRSKTKTAPVFAKSLETKTQSEARGCFDLGHWVSNLVDTIKHATVTVRQISSAER